MNNTGFGFLRLPMKSDKVDFDTVCQLTDAFLSGGGRVFDTCPTYLNGQSESAIRDCLVNRHPRNSYELCDKLPGYQCRSWEDCQAYYQSSLTRCGVDYFDIYMLHGLNQANYRLAEEQKHFSFLRHIKESGGTRAIGFSYHDSAELLDEILTTHPETDVVLLQLNYLDWNAVGIQSRLNYEVCLRHGVRVWAMEPVKGGTLAKLPPEAESLLQARRPEWSAAQWALRFVQGLPGLSICLSGMNTLEQVEENLTEMSPLTAGDRAALLRAGQIIEDHTAIACTGCGYCLSQCPEKLNIPTYFRLYNELQRAPDDGWKILPAYQQLLKHHGAVGDCLNCGSCTKSCPQKLDIPGWMNTIAPTMEENPYE